LQNEIERTAQLVWELMDLSLIKEIHVY